MKIRGVLLDATGVLFEPAEPVGRTYSDAAVRHGVVLPAWRLEDAFRRVLRAAPPRVEAGRTGDAAIAFEQGWWRERVRQTFQAADSTIRFDDFDAFFEDVYDHFSHARAWRLRRGTRSGITAVRDRGLRTGVVSNFDHRLPRILEELGIASLFDVVMIPSICGAAKPDPAIFMAALAVLDIDAHETIYVGHDAIDDMRGASRAGLVPLEFAEAEGLDSLPTRIEQVANLGG